MRKKLQNEGFKVLYVKVGRGAELDVEIVDAVRKPSAHRRV